METMTRRTALGTIGVLAGLGLAGAGTLISGDAKKHKKHKRKHKKGRNTPGGNTPPPDGGDPTPAPVIVTQTFTQLDAVGIPQEGVSKPYPSEIVVDGFAGSTVTKVTVRIPGFQHNSPFDVDMLLVGPQGQNVVLMSDVGRREDNTVLVDITFDDDAPAQIPSSDPLANGTFLPSNFLLTDEFPAPAPAPDFAATLSVFTGTDPNGTWQLFIVDDSALDGGVLIGGWSLTITAKFLNRN
jgi:subtilisin-like proprotein convertase family protein